jgi:Secretion system C-terminal sorting domain
MIDTKKSGSKLLIFGLLLGLILTFSITQDAEAVWHTILAEKFERDVATFPWITYGNSWARGRTGDVHTWSAERGVYHEGHEDDIRSLWCVGHPGDLLAGLSIYPPNVNSFCVWGPFDLDLATASNGSFWELVHLEDNSDGDGDDFYLGVIEGPPTLTLDDYGILYQRIYGTNTNGDWLPIPFDFDSVRTENGMETFVGLTDLYLALIFTSDGGTDPNPDENLDEQGYGVFIDDINFGYDDGLFDFDSAVEIEVTDAEDPERVLATIEQNQEVKIRSRFRVHSDQTSNPVNHVLYVDDVPSDTIRASYLGSVHGTAYEIMFDRVLVFSEIGEVTFRVVLDDDEEQDEYSETNNETGDPPQVTNTYQIVAENTPPSIIWIQPNASGIQLPEGERYAMIIYEAFNNPSTEEARVTFYYDFDNEGFNGSLVSGGINLIIESGVRDTINWYITDELLNRELFVYAKLQDSFHETIREYALGSILDVEEDDHNNLPSIFRVASVYPNPFNPTVELRLELPQSGNVTTNWYSIGGRLVDSQIFNSMGAGANRIQWTPENLPSGAYFVKIHGPENSKASAKVIYMK